jgi:hypothetical protein
VGSSRLRVVAAATSIGWPACGRIWRAPIDYDALLTVLGDERRQSLRSLAGHHARELGLTIHIRREILESKETGLFASRVLEAAQALDAET